MSLPLGSDLHAAAAAVGEALAPVRWPERVRAWAETEARASEPWCVALSGGADSVALLLTLVACRDELRRNAEWRMQNGESEGRDAAPPASEQTGDVGQSLTPCGNVVVPAEPTDAGGAASLPSGQVQPSGAVVRPRRIRNPQSAIRNRAAPIVALHFNHRLRGAAADADEAFCRELCAALEVELRVGAAEWAPGSEVSEAQARDARFAFFDRAMREAGARALWVGHQRDDVVETMLLRLSRGSGARGLAAPRPVQRLADGTVRLRPFLDVPKAEIVAALRAAGVPWCEDATNHGEAYFRNRLRNRVLPAWREAAPADLAAAVARSRALLDEEDEALELWVDRILPAELGETLPLTELRAAPVAVTRRALHRWLGALELGGVLASAAFEDLLAAVRAGSATRLSAGDGGFLETEAAMLRFQERAELGATEWGPLELPVPGEVQLPDGARLRAERVALDVERRRRICAGELDDGRTAFLAARETSAALSIRSWRAGDRYRPLGTVGTAKLQDQFVNRRIARGLRGRLPLICTADGAILWVPGLPPAHEARVREGTTMAVQLTYLPLDSLSAPTGHV